MRSFIIAPILLAAVLTSLFLYDGYVKRESDALLKALDPAEKAVGEENWEKAEAVLSEAGRLIEEKTPRLAIFTDHDILDEIGEISARASAYAKNREGPELAAEIEALKTKIAHIPKRESFSFYNIF